MAQRGSVNFLLAGGHCDIAHGPAASLCFGREEGGVVGLVITNWTDWSSSTDDCRAGIGPTSPHPPKVPPLRSGHDVVNRGVSNRLNSLPHSRIVERVVLATS